MGLRQLDVKTLLLRGLREKGTGLRERERAKCNRRG